MAPQVNRRSQKSPSMDDSDDTNPSLAVMRSGRVDIATLPDDPLSLGDSPAVDIADPAATFPLKSIEVTR